MQNFAEHPTNVCWKFSLPWTLKSILIININITLCLFKCYSIFAWNYINYKHQTLWELMLKSSIGTQTCRVYFVKPNYWKNVENKASHLIK